jgi:hypothetical protein
MVVRPLPKHLDAPFLFCFAALLSTFGSALSGLSTGNGFVDTRRFFSFTLLLWTRSTTLPFFHAIAQLLLAVAGEVGRDEADCAVVPSASPVLGVNGGKEGRVQPNRLRPL